jgi:hypothetical protein
VILVEVLNEAANTGCVRLPESANPEISLLRPENSLIPLEEFSVTQK